MSMAMATAAMAARKKVDQPLQQLQQGISPGVQASGPFAQQISDAQRQSSQAVAGRGQNSNGRPQNQGPRRNAQQAVGGGRRRR